MDLLIVALSEQKRNNTTMNQPDMLTILTLPVALRKTIMALMKLNKATAQEIATETGRSRAAESSFANQLARINFVKKERVGQTTYFFIEPTEVKV